MEIVFVRHGQTDLNKTGCIQGSRFDKELNEAGRAYAEKAAANFDPSEFDVVFSSPMKRALETAQIFTKGQKKIKIDERLVEFNFGEWDGQLLTELGQKYPDAVDPWGKANANYIKYAPHGESNEELNERCGQFLDDLTQNYAGKKVLVVCHGTLIRMMFAHYFTNGDFTYFDTMKNCALAKISYRDHTPRINYYNQVLAL
ncbi:histidine phosphatase family protein [Lactobacillus sp. ESL0703]|uniref:histidine phosphatase family protein n=1 Tax=Lactobacillus sp. ESL0703 TaxID=2983218 RepID=UPI0023F677F5|nr:histidine phosphatase family protein [Lactobacillus sp. ESL0703]MDF7669134.1 histidine phosphatase family protein [Lactobacillus sp. ESL0703]